MGESRSTQRKTSPTATLSTTNPTWTDLGTNKGLHGERLYHGMEVLPLTLYRITKYLQQRRSCVEYSKRRQLVITRSLQVRLQMLVNLQIFLYLPEVIALCFGTSMAISLRL
jgi:hypothetical protein